MTQTLTTPTAQTDIRSIIASFAATHDRLPTAAEVQVMLQQTGWSAQGTQKPQTIRETATSPELFFRGQRYTR